MHGCALLAPNTNIKRIAAQKGYSAGGGEQAGCVEYYFYSTLSGFFLKQALQCAEPPSKVGGTFF